MFHSSARPSMARPRFVSRILIIKPFAQGFRIVPLIGRFLWLLSFCVALSISLGTEHLQLSFGVLFHRVVRSRLYIPIGAGVFRGWHDQRQYPSPERHSS